MIPDEPDVFRLPQGGSYRLIEVGRLAVDLAVHGSPHFTDNPDILQIHQGKICSHQAEHLDNLGAFF